MADAAPSVSRWPARLSAVLPFLRWWPSVNAGTLRADLIAGLTGAIIVLPQGVAFATIAGLPPQYGLYTAMVPSVVAALFGSSWHLVSGPTTAISIVVFGAISPLAEPGSPEFISLTLSLTFLVGAIQLAMGLGRMGALVNFISHTVVIGFTAGAAILIASSQLKNFFGVPIPRGASFLQTVHALLSQAGQINPHAACVGAVTLGAGIFVKRFVPRVPYMIAALLVGSMAGVALAAVFGPGTRIDTVGALPTTLPPLSYPVLSPLVVKRLGGNAFAVTMLALTEAVSIGRAIAIRSEQRIDGNQEFVGQGLSNIVGSFFSSYAASGSFNRSGANYEAGARTPLAAAFASLMLAAILLVVAPLAAYLPVAAMAGVLLLVAWGLIDIHHIRGILQTSRSETAILLVTFVSTLVLDLEFAIYAGVILSLGLYLSRTSRPPVRGLLPDRRDPCGPFSASEGRPECAQLKIVDVHGSLFFGATDHVLQRLQEIDGRNPGQRHVLIVADGINFADVAGAEMLAREARRRRRMGGGLYLVGLKERTLDVLRTGGYLEQIGEENVFDSRWDALAHIRRRLDPSACERCAGVLFDGCGSPELFPQPTPARLETATSAATVAEGGAAAAPGVLVGADRAPGQPMGAPGGRPDEPLPPAREGRGSGTS
jgi:sulfate permease, SulP family